MDVDVYCYRIQQQLPLRKPVTSVEPFEISTTGVSRAVIRARVHFYDGSFLEIRERVDTSLCYPSFIYYAYQYVACGTQDFRYDNAHEYPELSTSPDHKHIGHDENGNVESATRPSYRELFEEIGDRIGSRDS